MLMSLGERNGRFKILMRNNSVNDVASIAQSSFSIQDFAEGYFNRLRNVLATLDLDRLEELATELESARVEGRTIFVAGNGGSATTATSMANDLGFDILKKTGVERSFRVHALTDNLAAITAVANDVGYDRIFLDQMRIHFRPGDTLIVISASGNSPNVVAAAEWAKEHKGKVIGLVGFDGGRLSELADILLHCVTEPTEYGPVEDTHLILNHVLAHWFQARLRK
jgi:D-sedoheptulose 7-phosphate isomerase